MSKTSICLLIAWIAGFAFFKTLKAADFSEKKVTYVIKFPVGAEHLSSNTICLLSKCVDSLDLIVNPTPDPTKKRKFIAALFALPFPFGFVGAHRVMLGSGPWIPVIYVATLGGCFGLLPLIDFCFITFSKDITPYQNNTHVFMWIK